MSTKSSQPSIPLFHKLREWATRIDKSVAACDEAMRSSKKLDTVSGTEGKLRDLVQEVKGLKICLEEKHAELKQSVKNFNELCETASTSLSRSESQLQSHNQYLQKYGYKCMPSRDNDLQMTPTKENGDAEEKENSVCEDGDKTPELANFGLSKYALKYLHSSRRQPMLPPPPPAIKTPLQKTDVENRDNANIAVSSPCSTLTSCTPTMFKNAGIDVTPGVFINLNNKQRPVRPSANRKCTPLQNVYEELSDATPEEPELTSYCRGFLKAPIVLNLAELQDRAVSTTPESPSVLSIHTPEEPSPSVQKKVTPSTPPLSHFTELDLSDSPLPPSPELTSLQFFQ